MEFKTSLALLLTLFSIVATAKDTASSRLTARRGAVAQALARGDLKKAEELLRQTPDDALYWGRLKYQDGDFKAAAKRYQSVSRSSSDYIRSREELAWTYLQLADWGALRGLLVHLNTTLVPIEERMEGRVLSAIAYLKDCQYDDVKKEISLFQKEMLPFVRTLERPPQAKNQKQPPKGITKELASEAILKMRFVRVALLNQLKMLEKMRSKQDVLSGNQLAEADTTQQSMVDAEKKGKMVYPIHDDIWVDELFRARAVSATECESLQKGQGT